MFKAIAPTSITAEEITNRILAYASLEAANTETEDDVWYGNIETYTLNLRLSGIINEKPCRDVLTSLDTERNNGKYIYLEERVFYQENQHLDNRTFVEELYRAFLRREADLGGLESNVQQLSHGASREQLIVGMRNSGEADGVFLRVTDCLEDSTFLDITYRVYLEEEYHQQRRQTDLQALNEGESRQKVFTSIRQFQKVQIVLQNLTHDFAQEDQIFLHNTKHLDEEAFVAKLYLTYLKREADSQGKASHIQQLYQGISRQHILIALRTSQEAAAVFTKLTSSLDDRTFLELAYRFYLKRELENTFLASHLQTLNQGKSRQELITSIS
jgi:hypothetical protein